MNGDRTCTLASVALRGLFCIRSHIPRPSPPSALLLLFPFSQSWCFSSSPPSGNSCAAGGFNGKPNNCFLRRCPPRAWANPIAAVGLHPSCCSPCPRMGNRRMPLGTHTANINHFHNTTNRTRSHTPPSRPCNNRTMDNQTNHLTSSPSRRPPPPPRTFTVSRNRITARW